MPFNSLSQTIWMDSFMLSISFSLLFLPSFFSVVVHKSKDHEVSICTWHYGKSMCVHRVFFLFNFYANYVILFKIFMLSNFKHEFCMSHIILWQHRWQQQQQQHRRRQKNKFQLFSANLKYQKKCVCVECAVVASVFFSLSKSI